MQPLSPKRKINLGYAIAFLLLLFSYLLLFYSTSRVRRTTSWVSHTFIVIAQLEGLKAALAEAEAGARGFIVTKDEKFLTPYNNSLQTIPAFYDTLRLLTKDNPQHQQTLDTLHRLLQKRLGLFKFGLQTFRDSGFTVTQSMTLNWDNSRLTTDSIRFYIRTMRSFEEKLLADRSSTLSGLSGKVQLLIIISLITAIIAILYSVMLYKQEHKKADNYQVELENYIRKLKIINEELAELRSMEKFAATGRIARTIAHEVRNPLTNIALAGEQLQELATEQSESSMLLDMINRNATRINQLVSDLLNATKSVQLDLQRIRINELLDETLLLAKDRIDLKQIRVEKEYSVANTAVAVDIEKMSFAFLNIIVNAIEAMEKGAGILTISTKKEEGKCIIEIRDNGKGMNEEILSKIFEPYFTGKATGNGLGLTNTENIILTHKGSIKVQSQEGKGTVFTVSLDCA